MNAKTIIILLLICATGAYAHVDNPGVKVRVVGYDPATTTYTISCQIPPADSTSRVDPRRFYAIDPIPQGSNRSYYSTSPTFTWRLNPVNYTELVHRKAMYHMYCEVQNYSAPPGSQNMASEVHVDLRTTDNQELPTVYVLSSHGPHVRMKCDPPRGTTNYDISWSIRNRDGSTSLPGLNNQRIADITLPEVGSGWDVLCSVHDKDTGKTTGWDMPLEVFSSGPAYVPTIEGCFPNEPCYISPTGIPPNSTLLVASAPGAQVFINEALEGTTDASGNLRIANIVPGVYNIVLRKQGYDELSTLVPLPAGRTVSHTYQLQPPTQRDPWNMCHTTVFSLPATCTGTITSDTSSACRTVSCADGANSLKVLACNKPDGSPTHFEMYKQAQTGSGVRICLGNTCLQNEGFVQSQNYPICLGTTPPACTPTTEVCDGKDNDCNGQVDENNVCGTPPPSNSTCYNSVQNIPASCTGASITSDTWTGGRTITCGTLRVQAWDKTGFFELYKQSTSTGVKICLGSTCISDNGYAKSPNFPICIAGNNTPPTSCTPSTEVCDGKDNNCNGQVDENNVCGGQSLTLSIAPWFPQGRNYVFKCTANGFAPSSYQWLFGDGHQQTTTADNVYHTYANAGTYGPSCSANGMVSTLQVTVA